MVNARGLPFALRGAVAPTYVWAPEHEIEHAALDQLRNISKLPWVHGVLAMPDVHLGNGATVGSVIAERHIHKAKTLDWNTDLPDRDLAVFLHRDEAGRVLPEWDDYLHDLYWAQDYALLNRHVMLALLTDVLRTHFPQIAFDEPIQCHHNYVSEEVHDGLDLVVTRKGAISARTGQLGIIPGSMGTGSFIVSGLGSEESFQSASHGAGRRMSRARAKREFTIADLAAQTAGVEYRKDGGVLDEIPAAYKDLNEVMANQSDLVTIEARLETILCVKG